MNRGNQPGKEPALLAIVQLLLAKLLKKKKNLTKNSKLSYLHKVKLSFKKLISKHKVKHFMIKYLAISTM